jgi:hypothetical protein
MLKYYDNLSDFWTKDLVNYKFPESVNTGQREGLHKNYFSESNNLFQGFGDQLPACRKKFFEELEINIGTISWICIQPGRVIPTHTDRFYKLRTEYKIDIKYCLRYLVFLQDWELGHIVEFEEHPITKWKKGDVWVFDHLSPHCAANTSNNNFVTCQVNTFVE